MPSSVVTTTEVNLQVYESGDPSHETVVLVHGWPDNHAVWDGVAALLRDDFHVVSYDVRGTGASSAPAQRSGYRMRRLIDDLVAVVEHVRPDGRPVHLVGHDWGSVQGWGAVLSDDPRLAGRIATYTSLSGPALAMFGRFLKSGRRKERRRDVLHQMMCSWYIVAFQVPYVPELVLRRFGARLIGRINAGEGLHGDEHTSPTFTRDAVNGLNLYRENGVRFDVRATDVPVQLLLARRDTYVTPAIFDEAESFASDLTRVEVDGSHWVVVKSPELIAGHIRDFVERH